ncbi:MAG TPA: hypothetical protein V6D06_12835 [Trichocoleus sp.]
MSSSVLTAIRAVVSLGTVLAAPAAFANSFAGTSSPGALPDAYQAALQTLGIDVLVPGTVPPGFTVSKLEVEPCPVDYPYREGEICRFGPAYRITYRDDNSTCFAIEAVGGGVGGAVPEYSFDVETALFGVVPIGFGQFGFQPGQPIGPSRQMPTLDQRQSPQANTMSGWMGTGPFYRVVTDLQNDNVFPCFRSITPEAVGEIVTTLKWLD